ncbi:hypothetical protein CIHG_03435 [Coccidioides immitis H538.4]|uniref:Uncharacterized protein n=1 Tax=Coccidioides immitis H538.4 TaxID=396776 RepID=A0A0J8RMT7_COCIT|nr:hypothetical protein CIHG_03435 [Coccidioides immitis H538.4]
MASKAISIQTYLCSYSCEQDYASITKGLIRVKQSGRTRRAVEDPALNSPTGADAMALASGNPRLGTGIRPTKAALGRSIDAVSSPGDTIKIEDSGSECSGLL